MPLRRGRRGSKAFSLVELLIVIGIIILLAGFLLSALNRAREMSRRTVCLSNIRQLTQAWLAYAAAEEGRLPNSIGNPQWLLFDPQAPRDVLYTPVAHDPIPLIEKGQLWPYLNDRRPLICPADPQSTRNVSPAPPGVYVPGGSGTSYTMNIELGTPQRSDLSPGIANLRLVRNPARQMAFFEGNDGWLFDGSNFFCEINSYHPSTAGSFGVLAVSFVDGHAIMWTPVKWGSEQRSWVSMKGIDSVQFVAWMNGVGTEEITQ